MSKKPRLDQIPAANLDADDPLTDVRIFFSVFFPFSTCLKDLLLVQYVLLGHLKISDRFQRIFLLQLLYYGESPEGFRGFWSIL